MPQIPRVHPLALLIGFAVVAYGFSFFFGAGELRGGHVLNGSVTHVRDGDTIVVSGTPIRFAKLDCAELGTASGERAKQKMVQLVNGHRLECRLSGRRSYDRIIGECDLPDGRSLSGVMIGEGYCSRWW